MKTLKSVINEVSSNVYLDAAKKAKTVKDNRWRKFRDASKAAYNREVKDTINGTDNISDIELTINDNIRKAKKEFRQFLMVPKKKIFDILGNKDINGWKVLDNLYIIEGSSKLINTIIDTSVSPITVSKYGNTLSTQIKFIIDLSGDLVNNKESKVKNNCLFINVPLYKQKDIVYANIDRMYCDNYPKTKQALSNIDFNKDMYDELKFRMFTIAHTLDKDIKKLEFQF